MMPGVRMKQLSGDANASARFEPFSVAGIDELHARDRILRLIDFILTAGHAERPNTLQPGSARACLPSASRHSRAGRTRRAGKAAFEARYGRLIGRAVTFARVQHPRETAL